MAVSFTAERAEVSSTANASTYDTGSFTPTANGLLILCYQGTDATATFALSSITTVSGTSLTWTAAATGTEFAPGTVWQNYGMYYCLVPSSTAATVVRLTWDEAITSCSIWIGEFSGHNTSTPITQTDVLELASGVETHSLDSAVDANSMSVYMNASYRNPPGWDASGDGWTEDMDAGTGTTPSSGLFVAHKANDQTITFTGTDGLGRSIIAEIAPAGTNANVALTDVQATTTVPTPVVTADAGPVPGTVNATTAIATPVVTADADITPSTVTATTSIDTPVVTGDAAPVPATVTATTTVDTPTVTTTFDPSSITGLLGWYKADAISASDGDPVTTWEDAHTTNNDLVATTNGPTYKTNIQNGLPVVRFDGTNDNLQLADTSKFRGTGGFSLFIVGKYTYTSSDPIVANSAVSATVGYRISMHTTDGIRRYRAGNAGSSSAVVIDTSDFGSEGAAFDYMTVTFDAGTGGDIRRNGVQLGTTSDADVHDAGTGKWSLMTNPAFTLFSAGDIAEILYYESDLSSTDRDSVEGYLLDKWFAASPDADVALATVNATTTIPTPVVTGDADLVPGTVTATTAVDTPVVTGDAGPVPGTVNATTTVPTPVIALDTTAVPTTVDATTTVPTPVVTADALTVPTTVNATTTVPTPVTTADALVTPSTVNATTTVPTPAITGDALDVPSTVNATTTVPTPAVTADANTVPTTVNATTTVPTPVTTGDANIVPTTVNATTTIDTPAVTAGSGAVDANVGLTDVQATSSIPTPAVSADALPSLSTVNALASVFTPAVVADALATLATLDAVAIVPTPSVEAPADTTAGDVLAVALIFTPTISLTDEQTIEFDWVDATVGVASFSAVAFVELGVPPPGGNGNGRYREVFYPPRRRSSQRLDPRGPRYPDRGRA